MSKRIIRNFLLWIFSALMFVSIAGLVVVSSTHTTKAKAASETTWQTGVFEMDDGASLKLGSVGGLRFMVKMEETVYNFVKENDDVEMGFIIAPKQLMVAANGDYLNMPLKIGGAIDKDKLYLDENSGFYYANGCITNLKAKNLGLSFTAVSYIVYNGEVRYTEYNDLARNNLYDTVNMAVLSGYAESILGEERAGGYAQYGTDEGWYGSESFPIVVENTAEYDELISIVDEQEIDLSDYIVVVRNSATASSSFVNVEKAPTIIDAEIDELNKLIVSLPDSITMPDAIGFIARIHDAENRYNALSESGKAKIENYAKVESLLSAIDGYDRVYMNDATDGTVIPSYVPNYTSTIGGTATMKQDSLYGNVLKVTSDTNGKAALSFTNFPSVEKYEKIYFFVKVSVGANLYLSDGTANDGWGLNWKNNWSVDGFWCNENTARLVEVDVSSGYINTNFALGFRADSAGFTFEISDFYGLRKNDTVDCFFGTVADSGETNEYGTVYNISREQWYIDNNNTNTIGTLQTSELANNLISGYEYYYFWMYNGTGTEYNFHLAGDVSGTWTDSADTTAMKAGEWTKIVISGADIELNKNGQWYVYILGGDGQGAAKDGWKISPIYVGPSSGYTDHADVKAVIALIDALPDTITLSDKAAVENAYAAYSNLTTTQQALVTNLSKLTTAKAFIDDNEKAQVVIDMIDSINARDVDEALVNEARAAYNALTATQQSYVSNIATLEAYEADIKASNDLVTAANNVKTMIANLPDSVVMPDNLVFVPRIEAAKTAYDALSDEGKGMVDNYAKLRSLLSTIKGYETVHIQTVDSVNVVPSHVPNYTSTIGGTATTGYDAYYGNYLKVTPNAGGKVAIQYINFPDVSQYTKIFFNIRVVGESCNVYISDGITNDGWGDNWKNNWSMDGFWANNGNWIQKEVEVSTGILTSNWALGLRVSATDVSFEITDIVGYREELGTNSGLTFGNFTDSGSTNAYGTVYNFTQGWSSDTDMGAFNQYALSGALASGHDSLQFWIYNPNDSAVDFKLTGDMNSWNPEGDYVTNLPAKAWTKVIITPEIIAQGDSGTWFVNVTTGAGTSGWQISPMYSFSASAVTEDRISAVQARIDALDTETLNEYQVQLAREAYEALSEVEKSLITNTNLITCETALYGNVANAPFIVDGVTSYKLYIDQTDSNFSSAIKVASAFVNEQLVSATGVKLSVVTDEPTTLTKYRYAIVFGYRGIFENLGMQVPEYDYGSSGYAIQKVGRTVFILADSADGYRMGALAFLREVIGYDMISEDCIVYDATKAATLPDFNVAEKPAFEYRQQQTVMTEDEVYGMGLQSHTDIWIPSAEGWDMHNALHYIPVETYGSTYSNWYNSDKSQPCPTAHGNQDDYDTLIDVVANGIIERIILYPTIENISFSIMDSAGGDACTCSTCTEYTTLYGSFAAAWIDLMNDINATVQAYINTNMPGRKLNLAFLAYRSTEAAPVNDDYTLKYRYEMDGKTFVKENGEYVIDDSEYLKCDENVAVWLAPIDGKYAENFNHADNAETLATIKKWTAISGNVYLWMYGTNFKYFMYPYNTWKASAENYKILADLGVKAAWSQSIEKEGTAFTDLKAYIDAQFMLDVNADYETVLDTYFTNYYGAAGTTMRSLFDKIVAKCEEIEANYDGLGRGIYDDIENTSGFLGFGGTKYWTKAWIEECVALIDQAYADIAALETSDPELYQKLSNRIKKESLFPRYVLCTTFASSYSSSNKKTMRQEFKADCEALGVTVYREADGELSDLYTDWGI